MKAHITISARISQHPERLIIPLALHSAIQMRYRQAKNMATKNERKTQAVSLRLRPSTVAAAKKRAKALDRSVASYIEQLIRRDVDIEHLVRRDVDEAKR